MLTVFAPANRDVKSGPPCACFCFSDLSSAAEDAGRKRRKGVKRNSGPVRFVGIPMFPGRGESSFRDSLRVDECTVVASLWRDPWGLQGVRVPFPLEEIWEHVHPAQGEGAPQGSARRSGGGGLRKRPAGASRPSGRRSGGGGLRKRPAAASRPSGRRSGGGLRKRPAGASRPSGRRSGGGLRKRPAAASRPSGRRSGGGRRKRTAGASRPSVGRSGGGLRKRPAGASRPSAPSVGRSGGGRRKRTAGATRPPPGSGRRRGGRRKRRAGAAAARGQQPPPAAAPAKEVTDHFLDDDVKLQFLPVRGYKSITWGLTVIPRSAALMGNMVVSTGQDATLRLFEFPAIGEPGKGLPVKQVSSLTRKDPGSGTHVMWRGGRKKAWTETYHTNSSNSVTFCNAAYVETRETLFTCGRQPEEVVTWDLHKLVSKDSATYRPKHQAFGICKVEEGASHLPPGCFVSDCGGHIRFWSLKEGLAANCTSRGGAAVVFKKPEGNFYSVLFHPESHLIYAAGFKERIVDVYDVRMTPSSAKDNVIAELRARSSVWTNRLGPSTLAFHGRNKEFIVAATGRSVWTWKSGTTSSKNSHKACESKVSHWTPGLRSLSETQYGDAKGMAEDELERAGYLFRVLGDDDGRLFERTRIEDSGGSVSFLAFPSLMLL